MSALPPSSPSSKSNQPYPFPPGGIPSGGVPMVPPVAVTDEERTWGMLLHLSFFVLGIIGPVIGLVTKKDSAFIQDQAKETLNFHLTITIVSLISMVTCIGPIIVGIVGIVFAIQGAIAANRGEAYRYPFNWRMIS